MKKNFITILLILFVPVVAYMAINKSAQSTARVQYPSKPQVLKFTSTMCLDCQKMNNVFKNIFPKYENDIILTEIHVQDGSSFTNDEIKKHNVTLVPTIILIDSNGKQVRRIEGAIPEEDMDKCLRELK